MIDHHLRGTAECTERSTCFKVNDIRLVSSHRMPCLTDFEGSTLGSVVSEIVPSQCSIGLTETEDCDIAVHAIEVSFHLGADLGLADLIILHVKSETGSDGEETERRIGIDISSVGIERLVQREIIEQVLGSGLAFT